MGQWSDIAKATVTILGPLFTGVWFLIRKWSITQEKLKRLEAKGFQTSVEALKVEIEESKHVQFDLTNKLIATREELIAIKTRLDMTLKAEERFGRSVENMREVFDRRVQIVEGTLDNGQIIRDGDKLKFQIKQKG